MRIDRFKFSAELVRQDMTQKDFAKKAGISRVTVNSIKNGRSCSDAVGYNCLLYTSGKGRMRITRRGLHHLL